jgi:multidrug transporter EmrE-like cation transporter
MTHWTLILIAAGANILLNLSLRQMGKGVNTESIVSIVLSLFMSPWAWFSVLCAVVLLSAFVAAIRVYSLSLTYAAVTAIAMVGLTAISVALQIETLSIGRMVGLTLIVAGILVSAMA